MTQQGSLGIVRKRLEVQCEFETTFLGFAKRDVVAQLKCDPPVTVAVEFLAFACPSPHPMRSREVGAVPTATRSTSWITPVLLQPANSGDVVRERIQNKQSGIKRIGTGRTHCSLDR